MAKNFPGPYEIRITHQDSSLSPVIEHNQRFNVALDEPAAQGLPFDQYQFEDAAGVVTNDLATLIEDFLTLVLELYDTTMSVTSVELWKYPTPQSFDSVFWAAYTPTANVGLEASINTVPSSQAILTFRTGEGGTMKLSLMEAIFTPSVPLAYAGCTADVKALIDFILDGDGVNYTSPFLARDTSPPIAFHRFFPGQSEALFKKRNRP